MVKIKSWGGAAIMVAVMLLAMQNAGAYEIVDNEQKTLIFHLDGTFDEITPNQLEAYPLEAGDEVSDINYILVTTPQGGLEYVPISTPALSSIPLEWRASPDIGDCSSESQCRSMAESWCRGFSNHVYDESSCNNGECEAECEISSTKCTRDSQCTKTMNCHYCQIGNHKCGSNGQCDFARCGIAKECGMECSTDEEAKEDCVDQYAGSSKYVKSARCSNGHPVCVTASRGSTPCDTRNDPVCKNRAEAACTYGYTGGACNIEKDCEGDIVRSECVWQCKSAPPTQICGDGRCTGSETRTNCPADCKTGPICGDGTCQTGETEVNCPSDCEGTGGGGGVDPASCGNNKCDFGETVACPADCANLFCGNGICDDFENERTCAFDCTNILPVCGNGLCESGENELTCFNDCGGDVGDKCTPGYIGSPYCEGKDLVQNYQTAACGEEIDKIVTCDIACENGKCVLIDPPVHECGNGECESTENPAVCPIDCTELPYCGDGVCNEPTASCPNDCQEPPNAPPPWGGGLTGEQIVIIGAVVMLILGGGALYYFMRRK
jgi:hypothetical protein